MKHILVPIRVFEAGDRVFTSEGMATVIHDEMEDFDQEIIGALTCSLESECIEKAVQNAQFRKGVITKLDYPTSSHPEVEEDYIVSSRDDLIPLKIYKVRPQTCPQCGGNEFTDESTAQYAQHLWHCNASRQGFNSRGCGEMFLVDPNKGV